MANQGFFGSVQKGLSDAITDIREKVVEEPMWGRSLSSGADAPIWQPGEQEQSQGFGSSVTTKDVSQEPGKSGGIWQATDQQPAQERDQTQDRGIDR